MDIEGTVYTYYCGGREFSAGRGVLGWVGLIGRRLDFTALDVLNLMRKETAAMWPGYQYCSNLFIIRHNVPHDDPRSWRNNKMSVEKLGLLSS